MDAPPLFFIIPTPHVGANNTRILCGPPLVPLSLHQGLPES